MIYMQDRKNLIENGIVKIYELLSSHGFSINEIKKFIENNSSLIIDIHDLSDNLYFLYNSKSLYSIIYLKDNNLNWWLYDINSFKNVKNYQVNDDALINDIVSFLNSEKFKLFFPKDCNDTLEDKMKLVKRIGLNKKGYNIK